MTDRQERELRTLAECLDLLVQGNLCRLGDTLMQRFKCVEMEVCEGATGMARHLELLPAGQVSSMSMAEREEATRLEVREQKLLKLMRRP